jgi:RHO1 GDP-GTP exchange protein 1/2
LGRSVSTGSTTSSFQSSPRPSGSTSATSPMYWQDQPNVVAGPSTFANHASINRGGSLSSFQSMGSGGSATSGYEQYDVYRQPGGSGAAGSSSWHNRVNSRGARGMMADIKQLALHEGYDTEEDFDEVEEEDRFVNLALLSHIAVRLRDKVPRGTHVKGGIPYSRAFTGKDIVVCIFALKPAI